MGRFISIFGTEANPDGGSVNGLEILVHRWLAVCIGSTSVLVLLGRVLSPSQHEAFTQHTTQLHAA